VGSLHGPGALLRAWRFARFLRRERIDVVQVYFPDSTYFGVPVARLAGVRRVVRTRNNLGHWLTPLHRVLGRLLNGLTTASVANSEACRRALIEAERPRPESVVVHENGVDPSRFTAVKPLTGRPGSVRRVGVVANLRHVKGLDVLVEAAALLAAEYPETVFRVAGEGPERAALKRQAEERGVAGRFAWLGTVADIPAFLSQVEIGVLCSRAEGMPNAVLEYMAAGRAVVATAVGSTTDVLADGVHGLLVRPDDAGGLAGALRRLLDDPAQAARLGAAARQRAESHYSPAARARRFEDFYERLMDPAPLAIRPWG
jgi:glycosyltransferase involved in cell wall biosynthesis